MQTGPETFLYLDMYGIKKVADGYECSTCGHISPIRGNLLFHIRTVHARKCLRQVSFNYEQFNFINKSLFSVLKLPASLPYRRNMYLTEKSPNKWYYGEFFAEKIEDEYHCTTCNFVCKLRTHMRAHLRHQHYREYRRTLLLFGATTDSPKSALKFQLKFILMTRSPNPLFVSCAGKYFIPPIYSNNISTAMTTSPIILAKNVGKDLIRVLNTIST